MRRRTKPGLDDRFREPGFWQSFRDQFLRVRRLLDCIQVEVTSRCPGQCTYCPHTVLRARWQSRDMDMKTYERLWPLVRRAQRVHLQGWGEPLLHPGFFEMAALARKAGCSVSTTTCGAIMDEELAERLVESGLDIVAFSLAGTDESSNASRAGIGFERVCEAISTLQAVRRSRMGVHLEIHLAYLMLASQMEAVRDLPNLMHRLGTHAAVVSTLDFLPAPELAAEGFPPHEKDKIHKAAEILRAAQLEARSLGHDLHWSLPRAEAHGAGCRENVTRTLFVGVDGGLSPCVYVNLPLQASHLHRRVFGNVRNEDGLTIWESDDFRAFRDRLAGGIPDTPCLACPKRFEV